MSKDDLVPPMELIFDGSSTQEEFIQVGEGFTNRFLIERAHLRPDERVLDVGCASGQKARVLAKYLSKEGSYEGFDIVDKGIGWCTEKYREYSNFRFQLADVYNSFYNPMGKYSPSEYKFPYADDYFDLVFLASVFTHMLPRDMDNYFHEISRVMKKGGRCVISFFLLNSESVACIDAGLNSIRVPFVYESDACRVADRNAPEKTVAHDELFVRSLYEKNGLNVAEITYGFWRGRRDLLGALQDIIIALKL